MLTIGPSPATTVPSGVWFRREVENLFQRLPLLAPPGTGRPMSDAHASGTTGSTTILDFGGMWATIHARVVFRVSGRESTRPLWSEETMPCAHSASPAIAMKEGRSAGRR